MHAVSIPTLIALAAALFAFVGLGLLLAGAAVAGRVRKRLRTYHRLPAQIVAYDVNSDDADTAYFPVFTFRTSDGISYQRTSLFSVMPSQIMPVGSSVFVLCDPTRPECADLETSGLPYAVAVLLAALGGPLLLIGGMLLLVAFLTPRLH
jgi:hypothetical protein